MVAAHSAVSAEAADASEGETKAEATREGGGSVVAAAAVVAKGVEASEVVVEVGCKVAVAEAAARLLVLMVVRMAAD